MAKRKTRDIEESNKSLKDDNLDLENTDRLANIDKGSFIDMLWEHAAMLVVTTDEILDEVGELAEDGSKFIVDVAAGTVRGYDYAADVVSWATTKAAVLLARKGHDFRVLMDERRQVIIKHFAFVLIAAVTIIGLFASVTNYEYSYNGRKLGIVREQREVLEILDMVSEELSEEYGSNITIDPETDITFSPVLASKSDLDDPDTVLKKFTFMGDIQASATAINVRNVQYAVVQNEKIATRVLEKIKNQYLDEDAEYVSTGFAEDVTIGEVTTTLSKIVSENNAYSKLMAGGQEQAEYEVVAGDTIYGILSKLEITMEELQKLNPEITLESVLHVGDKIITQRETSLLTVETVEIKTYAKKVEYETETIESDKYYEDQEIIKQEGKNGKKRVTAKITKHNGDIVDTEAISEKIIQEPVTKIVVKGTKERPKTMATGRFQRPVNIGVYRGWGMRWGRMHYGLDYAAPTGTPIYAADGGTVVSAGWSGAYGYRITIEHGNGYKTLYAHCSSIKVSVGTKVYKGQLIGLVGSTGRSTGPHCHFEIFLNGSNVNPSNYV